MNTITKLFRAAVFLASFGSALAAVHYVDVNSTNATPPYSNGSTAATNIQDAVDAAVAGDDIVVTNGTYVTGGVSTNFSPTRVAVFKPLTLRSVNGPPFTTIDGGNSVRCVYLTNGATLSGFTLTHGYANGGGGAGVRCQSTNAVVTNCVVTVNRASGSGGGAYQGTLNGCTLSGNSAWDYGSFSSTSISVYGGGAYGCTLNNCNLANNSTAAGYTSYNGYSVYTPIHCFAYGGGAAYCTLNDCTLTGNSASTHETFAPAATQPSTAYGTATGGGTFGCTLNNCALTDNWAWNYFSFCNYYNGGCNPSSSTTHGHASGGGASGSSLTNCTLASNYVEIESDLSIASYDLRGGGASGCTLSNCTLSGNSAGDGGGVEGCTMNNCTLTGNWADLGGGAYSGTLRNCALSGNSATYGGGAYSGTLNNCTLTGNSATAPYGGGAYGCTLTNCISYFNTGLNYDSSSRLNYCCTTPMPPSGVGNISSDPELASAFYLSPLSPCVGKGNYAAVSGVDIDGQPWANPPSMGCDEYHAGTVTGPLSVGITASYTNVAAGYAVAFSGSIAGRADLNVWTFGDGSVEINQPYVIHAWAAPGDYVVSLWVFNDSYPGGVSSSVTVHVVSGVHYVAANSANPAAPYASWDTAATNIQDAINAAAEIGAQVVVTNGTYASISASGVLTVRSVNGPLFTTINGGNSNRCVSLAANASLSGFTVSNGSLNGGGASGGALTNCILTGNSGGGASGCTLNYCTLTGNLEGGASGCTLNYCTLAGNTGGGQCRLFYGNTGTCAGGAIGCTLNNCTLIGNSGDYSGGAAYCTLFNCTLTGNSAPNGAGGAAGCTLNNCTLTGNSGYYGGGAFSSTLNNCTLSGNGDSGGGYAGGAHYSTLVNCEVTTNSGAGVSYSTLTNCTLTGNSAGGAYHSALKNCIVYFNRYFNSGDGYYDSSSTLNYCCTTPLPANGVGNISLDPQLASCSHLSAGSPCRGAGNAAYASGTDIDGEPWANPPCIGCDEFNVGAVTGPLSVGITASFTNVAVDFTVQFTGFIAGRTTASVWDFGDGNTVTNQPYTAHAWAAPGDYTVVLRAYNESQPGGITGTVTVHVGTVIHYVAPDSVNPVAPYTSWATAATNIQDAVDAATVPGALVLVTNGTYATGARVGFWDSSTNRVVVDKALSLRSVNGPQFTTIDGGGSVRCVNLTNGASLSGFTLTNGSHYFYGSGAYAGTLTNCTLSGNFGNGASGCTLNNCTLTGNGKSGSYGGGAAGCTLNNCTLSNNGSSYAYDDGGGAYQSTLNNCILTGNSGYRGAGAFGCTLNNCTLTGNSGDYEGGGTAFSSTLNNCIVTRNSGVGAVGCTLNNCTLSGNSGGGASSSELTNCTVTGNSGIGAYYCTLANCIVCFNSGGNFNFGYYGSTLNYCCTTPQPTNGVGNISLDPQLASFSHLSAGSPCRGAGNAAYPSGTDIDGEPWANPPSIGCDEYHAGAVTGPLVVTIAASFTNVAVNFTVQFTGSIDGRTTASIWDFGDGITITNQPYTAHAWAAPGDYAVVLRAYNESQPGGINGTLVVHVGNYVHYAAAGSGNPVAPFTSWTTAATNIQAAVNAAIEPGAVVLVTNGIYASISAHDLLTVRSVNGPVFTVINGARSNLCASLTTHASLSGFTLTNGAGGAYGGTVSNCTLTGNSYYGAGYSTLNNCTITGNSGVPGYIGGGASDCTLNNCALSGNSTYYGGGGASECTLNNCTLTGNSAKFSGGGAYNCTLNNCIAYFNTARSSPNYDPSCTLNYCCTTPQSTNGVGNISSDPQLASASHLSASSPCRGAGSAAYWSGTDIDGEAWANPPSTGCDEYQAGAVTGPLRVGIAAAFTNVTPGVAVPLAALIEGRTTASIWEFGDGVTVTNQPYTSHAWAATGDYTVVLRAYNESHPGGISGTLTVRVVAQPVHYVAAGSANPLAPYTSWATAATNIQAAVDAATVAGALVLVTNGSYTSGGRFVDGYTTNRVALDKPLAVQSVNGPQFTTINGGSLFRCVYLTRGASLSGFTVANGVTLNNEAGGGVFGESQSAVVSNCVVLGNSAYEGGGAYHATLDNCSLTNNYASSGGGGASGCVLINCALSGNNSAFASGGGAYNCALTNCTVTGNSSYSDGGGASKCTLNHCTVSGNSHGGASGCALINCMLTGNSTTGDGGGAFDSILTNCTLSGNSAANGYGGGASLCTLNNCTLADNSGFYGGGAKSSALTDCTLTGNSATYGGGGGVYACTLTDCTLAGNLATNAYASGGGASSSTLNNCTLTGNSAYNYGGAISCTLNNCALSGNSGIYVGGATSCMLTNCTLTGNSSVMSVGGTTYSTLFNCIVYFNTAPQEGNYDYSCALNYCCTTPQPGGIGNITDAPRFADTNGWVSVRLQSNSPCINAGNNTYAPTGPDLDGNPRISGGTVDMGAYEFQAPASMISYAWLQQFNLPIDPATDAADPDGDGVDNYYEWLAGTDPTNRFSSPAQLTITPSGTNVILAWPTNAVGFTLQSTTNLVSPVVWTTNSSAPVVIAGQNTVTNSTASPQQFYRLVH